MERERKAITQANNRLYPTSPVYDALMGKLEERMLECSRERDGGLDIGCNGCRHKRVCAYWHSGISEIASQRRLRGDEYKRFMREFESLRNGNPFW